MGRKSISAFIFLSGLLWSQCACGARCVLPFSPSIWPIAVKDYRFGTSQTFGQDSAYFPYNVLGEICTSATPTNPCADPCQVVSLGKGGFIVLEFDPPIADGLGADFIVFENAFYYGSGQTFDEWMIVSVSQDGEQWLTFPFDSITGEGLAGRTPTGCISCPTPINWQDPSQAGGDPFDLQLVGLPWAKYVKLTDATHWQSPDRLSADLDGVVAIHQLSTGGLPVSRLPEGFIFHSRIPPRLQAWDLTGRTLAPELIQCGETEWQIRIRGIAFLRVETDKGIWQGKVAALP